MHGMRSLILLFGATSFLLLMYTLNMTTERRFSKTSRVSRRFLEEAFKMKNNSTCVPMSNVAFLKTHKCASSAIQNIFLRYGYTNNKVFVLPAKGNYLGHPALFNRRLVPKLSAFRGGYNILTHHTRFNLDEMIAVMPRDTVFVTILRDPVALFESMFGYYELNVYYGFNITDLDSIHMSEKQMRNRFVGRIGVNQMMFDLGLEVTVQNDRSLRTVINYIKKLDNAFDLVMIAEEIEQSLVFLKSLLCWSTDDVVTFKVNARNDRRALSTSLRSKIRQLNWADQMLYDHFKSKFQKRLTTLGSFSVEQECNDIKQRTDAWYEFCVAETYVAQVLKYKLRKVTNKTCDILTTPEMNLTDIIRNSQAEKFPGSVFRTSFFWS